MIILDYAKINDYYIRKLWTKQMVHDAVGKGKITAEEYKEITNEDYIA